MEELGAGVPIRGSRDHQRRRGARQGAAFLAAVEVAAVQHRTRVAAALIARSAPVGNSSNPGRNGRGYLLRVSEWCRVSGLRYTPATFQGDWGLHRGDSLCCEWPGLLTEPARRQDAIDQVLVVAGYVIGAADGFREGAGVSRRRCVPGGVWRWVCVWAAGVFVRLLRVCSVLLRALWLLWTQLVQ